MAMDRPPAGGVCYYGHSNSDPDLHFPTAVGLLTGTTGHIIVTYADQTLTIKYDWMTTGWIAKITSTVGFAFSVYQSDSGDVFGWFETSTSAPSGPVYAMSGAPESTNTVYRWTTGSAGANTPMENNKQFTIFKMASTDVRSSTEKAIFAIPIYQNGVYLYPDSVSAGSTTSNGDGPPASAAFNNANFTVLGPLYSSRSSGVTTNSRFVHGTTESGASSIAGGSYTIGGYNYQIIGGAGSYPPIALGNGVTS